MITNEYEGMELDQNVIKIANQDVHSAFRYRAGVLEANEIEGRLPYLCNLDFLKGINFNKGCYVGQELTARSYHTGMIRRRALPFAILRTDEFGHEVELDVNLNVNLNE